MSQPTTPRILGRCLGSAPGPTVLALAAVHGNEPAGLRAAERVLARLSALASEVRGEVVFLSGNRTALARRVRYVDADLNRAWTAERVAKACSAHAPDAVESREQRELLRAISEVVDRARGPLCFLDMHTSSAPGPPFLQVGDTLRNRALARALPLPLILGLEEQIDGSLLEFLNERGFVTLGVEAGQHDAAESVDRLEAVLWLALVAARALPESSVPEAARYRALLRAASAGVPPVVEVRYRHAIDEGDHFAMEPGYVNFQRVRKGELLARDHHGLVLAPQNALILLPLYQGLGEDGFFLTREVRGFWLGVSRVVRRLRLAGLLRALPGVHPAQGRRGALVVNTRLARAFPLEVFHLFGYRKLRWSGDELVVSRRPFDLAPPPRIEIPSPELGAT
jgi:succinylglutamate desuccinylase/aspartoacylase family protein